MLVARRAADHRHHVGDEERTPHDDEEQEDHAQNFRGLLFVTDGLHGASAGASGRPVAVATERRAEEEALGGERASREEADGGRPLRPYDELVQAQRGFAPQGADGEDVSDHHDDERDEERHERADQDEVVVRQLAALVAEDFGVIVKAEDRDGHGDNLRQVETQRERERQRVRTQLVVHTNRNRCNLTCLAFHNGAGKQFPPGFGGSITYLQRWSRPL